MSWDGCSHVLAVDPSLRSTGVALFSPGTGELVAAQRLVIPAKFALQQSMTLERGQRCHTVARAIEDWYRRTARCELPSLVFEWPQIYRASKSKGDPNDLLPLVGIGMELAGLLGVVPVTPTPAEWCGQLKKFTKGPVGQSPRALRIRSRLSEAELKHWQDQHDIIDAIGLGLWHLGRLAPRRVYPGASE